MVIDVAEILKIGGGIVALLFVGWLFVGGFKANSKVHDNRGKQGGSTSESTKTDETGGE